MGVTSCFCHTIYKKVELVKLNVAAERNPAGNGFLSLPVWWFLPSVMEFVRFSPAQWNQDVSWRHEAASINSGTTRTRLPVQTLTGTDTSRRQWKEVSGENRASGETHSIWDACSVQWPRRLCVWTAIASFPDRFSLLTVKAATWKVDTDRWRPWAAASAVDLGWFDGDWSFTTEQDLVFSSDIQCFFPCSFLIDQNRCHEFKNKIVQVEINNISP